MEKVIKTAKMEHKNYKQKLNRMLRNYSTAPYNTTRFAPATALFGVPMKTKLPELTTPCSDAKIRQRDQAAKAKMEEHAENKRCVKLSAIKEGEIISVKRDVTKKNSYTPYSTQNRPLMLRQKGLW